jgi:hypothetical protein
MTYLEKRRAMMQPGDAVWCRSASDVLLRGTVVEPGARGGTRGDSWPAVTVNTESGWRNVHWPLEDVFPLGAEPGLPKSIGRLVTVTAALADRREP